jgi:hypothetical protein
LIKGRYLSALYYFFGRIYFFLKFAQWQCILSLDNSTAMYKDLKTLHPSWIWSRDLLFWRWTRWPLIWAHCRYVMSLRFTLLVIEVKIIKLFLSKSMKEFAPPNRVTSYFIPQIKLSINFVKNNGWATFWATFSQTRLVTLPSKTS